MISRRYAAGMICRLQQDRLTTLLRSNNGG